MSRAPQAGDHSRPKGVARQALRLRDRRQPLNIRVVYRGGSECWWELRARGVTIRRPGHLSLHDVLREFDGER